MLASFFVGVETSKCADFVPIKGNYSGLFYETNGSWQQSSGSIAISTTVRGTYSAKMQIGWARYSFSGRFDADGNGSAQILRYRQNPLTIQFYVDSDDPDLVFGTVGDGTWSADLIADRAVFDGKMNVSPDAGKYTIAILGDFTSTNTPGGTSVGVITVDKAARLRFVGTLADGTRVMQSSRVSKGGQWPLYSALYHGDGSLYGWVLFNGSADDDLSGDVTWIKPERHWNWYYPDGFAVLQSAWGSHYSPPPKGTRVLDITSGHVEFNGGNLNQGITNQVVLESNNRITNLSANGLSSTMILSNGSWNGRVMDPYSWDWIPFRAVVLQRYGVAIGAFFDWDQTGEVWLQGD
jgi:hypothetical protein